MTTPGVFYRSHPNSVVRVFKIGGDNTLKNMGNILNMVVRVFKIGGDNTKLKSDFFVVLVVRVFKIGGNNTINQIDKIQ